MCRRKYHQRQPNPEIINFKDLAPRKRQYDNAQELRDCNPTKHTRAHINQARPRARIAATQELALRLLHNSATGEHEGTRDMGAELDADADADDEVDERNRVEGDVREGHGAEDIDDDHNDGESDDSGGGKGAQEERREEED